MSKLSEEKKYEIRDELKDLYEEDLLMEIVVELRQANKLLYEIWLEQAQK